MDRSFQGLAFSLSVHAILVWILLHADFEAPLYQNDTTEIVIIEKAPAKKNQMFVTNPNPDDKQEDLLEKLKSQADYISEFTKRVKKEVIARNKDTTKNRMEPRRERKGSPEGIAGMEQQGKGDGFLAPGGDRNLERPIRNVVIGQSSIAEHIPGVDEGAFTALNTDQFTYYAFFARMNEQVRNRWVALIREYVDRLSREQMIGLASNDRQTVVEIVLNKEGQFSHSVIHTTSGDRNLDQATVNAFKRAAPFLNPPKEMVESDGFIHLKYGFYVRFRPPNFGPEG